MIPRHSPRKSRRSPFASRAERSVRRESATANSLGRVVPAAWTAAGLASAASPGGKPAGAGGAPSASAGRSGLPGLLDVVRGASQRYSAVQFPASIPAGTMTPSDAGLSASEPMISARVTTHTASQCPLTVLADTSADTSRRSGSALLGGGRPASALVMQGEAHAAAN